MADVPSHRKDIDVMRLSLIISLLILTASVAWAADSNSNEKQINVDMKSISYDPKIVNASIGDFYRLDQQSLLEPHRNFGRRRQDLRHRGNQAW